jgi:hypothetical protein
MHERRLLDSFAKALNGAFNFWPRDALAKTTSPKSPVSGALQDHDGIHGITSAPFEMRPRPSTHLKEARGRRPRPANSLRLPSPTWQTSRFRRVQRFQTPLQFRAQWFPRPLYRCKSGPREIRDGFHAPLYLAFSAFFVTTRESRIYAPCESGSACITPRRHVLVRSCNPKAPLGYFSDCPPWLPIIITMRPWATDGSCHESIFPLPKGLSVRGAWRVVCPISPTSPTRGRLQQA